MNKGFDLFMTGFDSIDEFLSFLDAREENTERIEVAAKRVRFLSVDQARRWYKTNEELSEKLGVSEELVVDTEESLNMIAVLNIDDERKPFLVGESSWISIKNRIDIYGGGFDVLSTEEKVRDMNFRFEQMGDKVVKIIIVDGKIRAIMSDMYAIVVASELFRTVVDYSRLRYGQCDTVSTYVDHNLCNAKLLFSELKDELSETYMLPDVHVPGIVIQTSDTGFSGNRIGAYWKTPKGSFIVSDEYVYIRHKGKISLDDIVDELPNLFLKYQNTLKRFSELLCIEIKNPVTTLKKACQKIKIAKKHAMVLAKSFEEELATSRAIVTAYDVCSQILALPGFVEAEFKTSIQEAVGKALNLNYEKIDASK